MTLHDVLGLFAYWRDYPPTHEILKSVYGVERRPETESRKPGYDPSGIGSLIARFPDGFVPAGEGRRHPGGGPTLGEQDYRAATQP
ncbi:hypothetical protein CR492_13430 [Methylocella silvestris]|uniref:Uncharacterized protein n=2 Tax=Methylocella silvestris TaxID=199596 RepID=A0A2J7TFK7_METSI|nr:hypothetical protein CR492_13430 [Methylocella silvestris]